MFWEMRYRRLFPSTSHEEYLATPQWTVRWMVAMAGVDDELASEAMDERLKREGHH